MKPKATFRIDGSFKLTGRGLVIYGDLVDGKIIHDNFIVFDNNSTEITLKIKGVDFMDNIKDNIAKVALTFYYDNDIQRDNLQALKVIEQTVSIFGDEIN